MVKGKDGIQDEFLKLSLRILLGPSDDDVKKNRKHGEETRSNHGEGLNVKSSQTGNAHGSVC